MCVLRVTDDDGNIGLDSVKVTVNMLWICVTPNAAFSPRSGHAVIVDNNKMNIMGGFLDPNNSDSLLMWSSSDGKNWTSSEPNASPIDSVGIIFLPRGQFSYGLDSARHEYWVVGGYQGPDIWSTNNLSWWSCNGINNNVEYYYYKHFNEYDPKVSFFKNKVWAIGGHTYNAAKPSKNIYHTTDGNSWIL